MADKTQINHWLRRLKALENERTNKWETHWKELSRLFSPRSTSYLDGDTAPDTDINTWNNLLDNAGILAVRVLSSGMLSGASSPSRPWFSLTIQDKALAEVSSVKQWLYDVEQIIIDTFARSNFYDQMHQIYEELAVFGTGVMLIEDDDDTGIRCRTFTAGEYFIDVDKSGRVDTLYRYSWMKPHQIVKEWGNSAPEPIKKMAENDSYEYIKIIHVVEPDENKSNKRRPFISVYFLPEYQNAILEESSFYEFPAIAPRWNSRANEAYGISPAMDALGINSLLEEMTYSGLKALNKEVDPALLIAHQSGLKGPLDVSPGAINYVSSLAEGANAVTPLYRVQINFQQLEYSKEQIKQQIKSLFFNDLFLMLAQTDKRMTATEVAERNAEKMLLLGPVIDRLRSEAFQPLIVRTFGVLNRKGRIPMPPPELEGQEVKIELISILAQAQKQAGVAAVNNTVMFIGNVAQMVGPEALDKLNSDQAIDLVAQMHGAPPGIIRSIDEVAQLRTARAEQQQQAMQAQQMQQMLGMAQQGASAAKDAGLTPEQLANLGQMGDMTNAI